MYFNPKALFMKQLVCLSLMACASASALFAQDITFKETKHDFGTIEESYGTVSHDFQFTNKGDKPLVIKQVITGCGCTPHLIQPRMAQTEITQHRYGSVYQSA